MWEGIWSSEIGEYYQPSGEKQEYEYYDLLRNLHREIFPAENYARSAAGIESVKLWTRKYFLRWRDEEAKNTVLLLGIGFISRLYCSARVLQLRTSRITHDLKSCCKSLAHSSSYWSGIFIKVIFPRYYRSTVIHCLPFNSKIPSSTFQRKVFANSLLLSHSRALSLPLFLPLSFLGWNSVCFVVWYLSEAPNLRLTSG